MDTKSFPSTTLADVTGKPSRLPAGSTLEVNGIHVPHPHAEVNLAGAGDPRSDPNTQAVTEYVKSSKVPGHNADGTLATEELVLTVETKPLADEVKPRRLTIATNTAELPEVIAVQQTASATENQDLAIRQDPADKLVELPKQ